MLAVWEPSAMRAATAALGAAIGRAAAQPDMAAMLATRFSDLFIWAAPRSIEFRRNAALVEIVTRPTPDGVAEMAFRPSPRFTDLVLAVADVAGAEVDFTDGWPVIAAQPPT